MLIIPRKIRRICDFVYFNLSILWVFLILGCTTIYYPKYAVVEKLYKPKKKLIVEVDVYKKYKRSENVTSNDGLTSKSSLSKRNTICRKLCSKFLLWTF